VHSTSKRTQKPIATGHCTQCHSNRINRQVNWVSKHGNQHGTHCHTWQPMSIESDSYCHSSGISQADWGIHETNGYRM